MKAGAGRDPDAHPPRFFLCKGILPLIAVRPRLHVSAGKSIENRLAIKNIGALTAV